MALFNPATTDIHRIDLPEDFPDVEPGDWVEINLVYNSDVSRRISMAYTRLIGGDAEVPFNLGTLKQASLEVIISRWSAPEAITPELIGKMDPVVRNYLVDEYDRLRPLRTEEAKKKSGSSSPVTTAPAAASSRKNSST